MFSFWQFCNFLACHFVITSVGLLYVNADMMRKSHEKILSNLKEGVVTVDKNTGRVMFANKAAKRLNKYLTEPLAMSID